MAWADRETVTAWAGVKAQHVCVRIRILVKGFDISRPSDSERLFWDWKCGIAAVVSIAEFGTEKYLDRI